jgi:hypothetical protein
MNYFFKEYYRYAYEFGVRNKKIEERFNHDYELILEALKKAEICRVSIPIGLDLTGVNLESLLHEKCEGKITFA